MLLPTLLSPVVGSGKLGSSRFGYGGIQGSLVLGAIPE